MQLGVAHLVRVPVVRLRVDALALEAGVEILLLMDAHRAADDLADAGHQYVNLHARNTIVQRLLTN